ncbi:MAG TPA: glutathione S-transferase family protein [Myxococcota bacterium]|nr:glutathione S-transferase family protein [Myxococcota bacterium]
MSEPRRVTIVGSYLSPYVRKALAVLLWKGLAYEIDPIVPFLGNDAFTALSPLRRIPVLIDGDVALCDSSVICQYLEDRYPEPAVYPRDVADRARARWLEEFADTRMGDVLIWRLFDQVVIGPNVWGQPTDEAVLRKTLEVDVPDVLDYLERQAPAEGFAFGAPSIADVAVAVFFRNARWARFRIDAARWPSAAGWVDRTLALPELVALQRFEDVSIRTPIAKLRAALAEAGAPLTADTYLTDTPRRGILRT